MYKNLKEKSFTDKSKHVVKQLVKCLYGYKYKTNTIIYICNN